MLLSANLAIFWLGGQRELAKSQVFGEKYPQVGQLRLLSELAIDTPVPDLPLEQRLAEKPQATEDQKAEIATLQQPEEESVLKDESAAETVATVPSAVVDGQVEEAGEAETGRPVLAAEKLEEIATESPFADEGRLKAIASESSDEAQDAVGETSPERAEEEVPTAGNEPVFSAVSSTLTQFPMQLTFSNPAEDWGEEILPAEGAATDAAIENIPALPTEAEVTGAPQPPPLLTDTVAAATEEPAKMPAMNSDEATDAEAGVLQCGTYGPFDSVTAAQDLADRLALLSAESALRQEMISQTVGYWVIIPPLPNEAVAIETLQELKQLEVKDVRRFFRGDYKNAISLGVFSQQYNAEKRMESLVAKGYGAIVKPRYAEKLTYWVDYQESGDEAAQLFDLLLEQNPEIKHQINSCSRIVTSPGIN